MKKYIVGLIIGLLISSTIVTAANYLYKADEVSYTPKDDKWSVNNVEGAINDLYDKANNKPTGTLNITANGNYNVLNYENVNINVSLLNKEFYRYIYVPGNSYTAQVSKYDAYHNKIGSTSNFSTNGSAGDGKYFTTSNWSSGDGSSLLTIIRPCQIASSPTFSDATTYKVGQTFRSFIYAYSYNMYIRDIPS